MATAEYQRQYTDDFDDDFGDVFDDETVHSEQDEEGKVAKSFASIARLLPWNERDYLYWHYRLQLYLM